MPKIKIESISAYEILDSRGNPTVECKLTSGTYSAVAAVPSGASTGSHEALELRDGDAKRFAGKGVTKAVKSVIGPISKALKGADAGNQAHIDTMLRAIDGTENYSKLGANAVLAVSLAAARLAAQAHGLELYRYINKTFGFKKPIRTPRPMLNLINGGAHADSGLDIQEYLVIPGHKTFEQRMVGGKAVFDALRKKLIADGFSTGVGDEGGFAPKLPSNEAGLSYIAKAVAAVGDSGNFTLGLDAASTEFYDVKKGVYNLQRDGKQLTSQQLANMWVSWAKKYKMETLEDGMAEDDFAGWQELTKLTGKHVKLIGDDLFVTNIARLETGIKQKLGNAILIKLNQIGSLTQTIEAIYMAQKAKFAVAISHRSGETSDTFIADLAVATNADFLKAGAPNRMERVAKYNRVWQIEREL